MGAIVTVFIERKLWPMTIVMMAGFIFAAARPELVWHTMSFVDFVFLVNVLVAWTNVAEDREHTKRVGPRAARRRPR